MASSNMVGFSVLTMQDAGLVVANIGQGQSHYQNT
jgi:hypothetical protein